MKKSRLQQLSALLLFCMLNSTITIAQIGNVIWEDNFDTLNTDIWNPNEGDGCDIGLCGWGNAELQSYSANNVSIEAVPGEAGNNALVLEARRENIGSRAFSSGKVDSENNLSIQYGLIEVRMMAPTIETGLWPAAWLLGTANLTWPSKGEIDMMEMGHAAAERERLGFPNSDVNSYVGANAIFANEDGSVGSIAYDAGYNRPYLADTPLSNRFVTYRLYWEPTQMRYTIVDNGVEHDLYAAPLPIDPNGVTGVFTRPFYLLLNLAVGGNFTDAATNDQVTASLPSKLYIDYVRVSQWNGYGTVETNYGGLTAETGTFGVYTETTPTSNDLAFGLDGEIYVWGGTMQEGTTAPYEGSEVLAYETTTPNSWFGGGVASLFGKDMSNYVENGTLKFKIKIPADVSFRIGITDNYTNESWITFNAGETQYGLTRNGEWGEVEIPLIDFAGLLAFQNINYMFAIASLDGAFPSSTFQLGIDDIVWEDGNATTTIPVTGVSVTPSNVSLTEGDSQQLTASITPENATNQNINWSSSNTAVAIVSANGLVTTLTPGTTTITATTVDGSYTATSSFTVTAEIINVTGINSTPTNTTLDIGQTQQITTTISPTNATNQNVNWSSSNTSIASVNNSGLVTAVAQGTTTITATTEDGGFTSTTTVQVNGGTSTTFVPDPTKTYYIDCPVHNLRIAANGQSEFPYTTSTTTIGDDVEWKFVDKGNGYWHIDRAAGGSKPRLRSNRTPNADMQPISSNGAWTYYNFIPGVSDGTFFLTLPHGPSNNKRLQVNNSGEVKMVSTASAGTWESFTITEVPANQNVSIHIEAEDYTAMNGIQTENTTDTGGGLNVGWIDPGDWMEYVVDIPVAGIYTVNFRVASIPGSAAVQFQVDGNVLTTANIAPTGGWQNWVTLTQNVNLQAGTQTIRLYSPAQNWNLNWFQIQSAASTTSARSISTLETTKAFTVFPVPAKEVVNLYIPDYKAYEKVEIMNLQGQILSKNKNITEETTSLNIQELPTGVYLIKLYKYKASAETVTFIK